MVNSSVTVRDQISARTLMENAFDDYFSKDIYSNCFRTIEFKSVYKHNQRMEHLLEDTAAFAKVKATTQLNTYIQYALDNAERDCGK